MVFIRFVLILGSLLVLTGCAAPSPAPTISPSPAAGPDALTPAEVAFVEQVATIAPPLAENPERLARRGANSCDSIARGPEVAIPQAVERFSGGSYTVTTEEAEAIVDAAEQTVCAAS
ncbi:hypothetical protein GCM10017691_12880 [Pseudonocardia petroleophila]|uniref:DUF732 domain-containing protein n=1 Tax=Pseudonocardia petroleophila TaxID=37331 RepID=A0A7G7MII5_9PSEU|nr:hypothetical protein [Pseudonocardia petroleophila]QNG52596.1 hypothetical protein H6H00_00440 [Pseudonocardia petroleophila]